MAEVQPTTPNPEQQRQQERHEATRTAAAAAARKVRGSGNLGQEQDCAGTVALEATLAVDEVQGRQRPREHGTGATKTRAYSASEALEKAYPIEENGRFYNPFDTFDMSKHATFGRLMKAAYEAMTKDASNIPRQEEILQETLPVVKPDLELLSTPPTDRMHVTWIGHASILVQLQGKSILFDPVFSPRCSPSQYFGPKRYRPTPLTLEELPPIDVCCVSHDHYDHMDFKSIQTLQRLNPDMQWFVPVRCNDVLENAGVPAGSITQLSWWQEAQVEDAADGNITFALTPAQHWGRRGTFDMWRRLWGSWTVIGERQRFFFTGDTGYCNAFKQIGHHYGPFDVAAIPIGAYAPRWFMSPQHIDPAEAVQVHRDLRAHRSFGIHWGTFKLTIEPYMEPKEELERQAAAAGLDPEAFTTMKHGETRVYKPVLGTDMHVKHWQL